MSHVRESVDSPAVVNSMKKIFGQHDVPEELFTDGGPQFVAKEFKKFTKDWDFVRDSSSPHFPQSNGMVERLPKLQHHQTDFAKVHQRVWFCTGPHLKSTNQKRPSNISILCKHINTTHTLTHLA